MKNVFAILLVVLAIMSRIYAQTPEKLSYQAIIRDRDNNIVAGMSVGMQLSILKENETPMYIERHFPTTNASGLVTLEIGAGIGVQGDFASIDWADGPFFLKTETDLNGGVDYSIVGSVQLVSVPYALHAKTATFVDDADADPTNELQVLSISADTLFLSNGGFVKLPNDGDKDSLNEIQALQFADNILYISKGNSVSLEGVGKATYSETSWPDGTFSGGEMNETLTCPEGYVMTGIQRYCGDECQYGGRHHFKIRCTKIE